MTALIFILCIGGLGVKAALIPFHVWLPEAMAAPAPVSALLHAVAVVKAGAFGILRMIYDVYGIDTVSELGLGTPLALWAGATILYGSFRAVMQTDIKKRLAYSTVSQLSYIIMGVALLTPHAIAGGLIHIVNHAFAKITLFFCAGAIFIAAHKKDISEMGGLGRVMPFTFGAFAVAALSMIGAPPVGGFVSKWYLLVGSLEAHQIGILLILITSTVLNAGYFAPVVYRGFFGKAPAGIEESGIREAPLTMLVPLLLAVAVSVLIGIYPDFMLQFVKMVTG